MKNKTAKELLELLEKKGDKITRGHLSYLKTQLNLQRGIHYEVIDDGRVRIEYTPEGISAIVNREDGRRKK